MTKDHDPYYNRRRVPDEFIEDVGLTGLSAAEEHENRERKYSLNGSDVRSHATAKSKDGKLDPYYQRKQLPGSLTQGVGETGLTKEEEFLNRERKYSTPEGGDVRNFMNPKNKDGKLDPYYQRQNLDRSQISGVGDTGMTNAEAFERRESKIASVDLSSDPFQQFTGQGHRASISGLAGPAAAAATRRRSSAVAPDYVQPAAHHHSGYDGDDRLATVVSRNEPDEIMPTTDTFTSSTFNPATTNPAATHVAVKDSTGHRVGDTGHTMFYDAATRDPDSIAPHEGA